ncbi:hypothetical protein J4211_00780 [Candidatus Woesearchaeota archaeon]|nr:hypothetical protein [Candidatus Woesearchaeota archaeon]
MELTKNCAAKLGHPNGQEIQRKLEQQLCKLHPALHVVIWIAEDSKKFYEPDFEPKEEHEIKWNVVTRYQHERFEDHWKSYVRYA